MVENYERVSMPFAFDVSSGTYDVLGAIGEQTAEEAGLENHYAFTEKYDVVTAGRHSSKVTTDGKTKSEVYKELESLEGECAQLGIHAKLEGEIDVHYHRVGWEVVKTTNISNTAEAIGGPLAPMAVMARGLGCGTNHVVDEHSYTISEYGALPGSVTSTLDRLEDTTSVKAALDASGRDKVGYELLGCMTGYADAEGNTAEVFGLTESSTFDTYREHLDTEVQGRKDKIEDGFFGKIPLLGKYIKDRQLAKVEALRERKADIIDQLEGSLLTEA